MGIEDKILEIVKIISKNSKIKDQILKNTNIILSVLKNKEKSKSEIEYIWDIILLICLQGSNGDQVLLDLDEENYKEEDNFLTKKEYKDILNIKYQKDFLEEPSFSADYKEYVENYIECVEGLLENQKINITLDDIEYDEDKDYIGTVSPKIYNKLEAFGYIFTIIDIDSDSYDVCILEKSDFNKIKNILEEDELLKEVIRIEHFNREF